ncbi:MAG: hypothetical protein ACRD3L_02230 [Terriglobales bacterium]
MHARAVITRHVLVLSSDAANSQVIGDALRHWMFDTVVCSSLREAADLMAQQDFALIFSEKRFADGVYPQLLSFVRSAYKIPVVVMISGDEESVFEEAIALGAFAVVAKPCSTNDVQWMVIQATQSEISSSKPRGGSRNMSSSVSHGIENQK